MQVTFTKSAPAGSVFAPYAFASAVGQEIDVRLPDSSDAPTQARGRLVAALVSENGTAVHLTVEIPDGIITPPPMHFSDVDVAADGTRTVRRFDFR